MARARRHTLGGHVYHVLNRGVHRQTLFGGLDDYVHFQGLMERAGERVPMRVIAYCLMPNHWHLVLWPEDDNAVSAYIHWLAGTHACYFNARHGLRGHVYQGRFKDIGVRGECHLLTLLRYVEANPVSAGLVERAELWPWSSVGPGRLASLVPGPVERPSNWLELLAASGPGPVNVVVGS